VSYAPPPCYKCGTIEGVKFRELGNGDVLPTCEKHKPLAVAMRDFRDAVSDAGASLRSIGDTVQRANVAIEKFVRRYRGDD
jgi:hypothetical protein